MFHNGITQKGYLFIRQSLRIICCCPRLAHERSLVLLHGSRGDKGKLLTMSLNKDRLASHGLTTRFGCPIPAKGVGERCSDAATRPRRYTRAAEGRVGHRPAQPGGLTTFFGAGDTRRASGFTRANQGQARREGWRLSFRGPPSPAPSITRVAPPDIFYSTKRSLTLA